MPNAPKEPTSKERTKLYMLAKARALKRLAEAHPETYIRFLEEELVRAGYKRRRSTITTSLLRKVGELRGVLARQVEDGEL